MGILSFIIFCFDPFHIGRRIFIYPVYNFSYKIFDYYRVKAQNQFVNAKDFAFRIGVVGFTVVIIIWGAVFMYVAFYCTYMPSLTHIRPVNMQFKTCSETSGPCTFPHAHVELTEKQQLLMVGQAYKIQVDIEMPESKQNQELGMFMVCAEMRDQNSQLQGHSCRSAMLRYRSPLIRTLTTWALSPLYVLGIKDESQKVPVEIFPKFLEERHHPVTDVYVEIQSHKIQFYSVTLLIVADFSGLRYIMFNFPLLSATVGISSNLLIMLVVFSTSWFQWSDSKWVRKAQQKFGFREHREKMKNTNSNNSNKMDSKFKDDDDLSYNTESSNSSKSQDVKDFSLDSDFEEFSKQKCRQRIKTTTNEG